MRECELPTDFPTRAFFSSLEVTVHFGDVKHPAKKISNASILLGYCGYVIRCKDEKIIQMNTGQRFMDTLTPKVGNSSLVGLRVAIDSRLSSIKCVSSGCRRCTAGQVSP